MDIFLLLFANLIPLYLLILLGWIAGRYFDVERQTLGALGIYILMPVVAFGFIVELDFQPIYAVLPLVVFVLFAGLQLIYFWIARKVYDDNRANLLSMCASAGNTGYFGLPLVLLLFDAHWVAVYIFAMIGVLIYEATVMYYIANRGQFNARQSFFRLLKFPTIYAISAGLLVNAMQFDLPQQFDTYREYFNGSYVVIGMMIIGASLSKAEKLVISPKFLGLTFLGKFVIWPLVAFGLISLDRSVFQWFSPEIHKMIFVMAIVPPAANIAAFAVQLDMKPEKAATTVLLGTLLALFYIPVVLMLSGFQ